MFASRKKTTRGVIGAIVLAGVLAVSGFALTNTIAIDDESDSGDGTKVVTTLAVVDESIDYTLDTPADPNIATSVTFDIDSDNGANDGFLLATTEVFIQPLSDAATTTGGSTAAGTWFACTHAADGATPVVAITCDLTAGAAVVALLDIDQFRVVAAD